MRKEKKGFSPSPGDVITYFAMTLILIAAILSMGCATLKEADLLAMDVKAQKIAEKTWLHDLDLEVNGERIRGVGVVKSAPQYAITIFPTDKIERVQWRSCHQEHTVDKPKSGGWFSSKYEFKFIMQNGIEDNSSCALEITLMEKDDKRIAFATVDFTDKRPEISLQHVTRCNGVARASLGGIGICQSSVGLVQEIEFGAPVVQTGAKPGCDVMRPMDDSRKKWRWIMAPGKCTYYFTAQQKHPNGQRYSSRLNTIGYTDVPPR